MALAHILKRFGEEAKRNLHNSAFLHRLVTVPVIGEQGVHDVVSALLEKSDRVFAGFDDFLFGFPAIG